MTSTFEIETFAAECKHAMAAAADAKQAARAYLAGTVERYGATEIIRALQAAIPPGATIGEMIVHASPELTMLYARLPGRLQSGIHDHTVCAVIAQLQGAEVNHFYQLDAGGALREVRQATVEPGQVLTLERDAIHSIENPSRDHAHALHLYHGDFGAISHRRSLWSWTDRQRKAFSFPALLQESATAMHRSGNRAGLDALVEAIPTIGPFVEGLTDPVAPGTAPAAAPRSPAGPHARGPG